MEKHQALFAFYARFFLCMSLFWNAGFNITGWNVQIAMLMPMTQSLAAPLLSLTTGADIILGIAILIGYMTRQVACLAAAYTFVNACVMHSFWTVEPGMQAGMAMNFFQSVGVAGGFLLLAAFGPGEFSADEKLKDPVTEVKPTSEPKA